MLSPELLSEAREWLASCSWRDLEPEDFADSSVVSDAQVVRGIARNYSGGLAAFVAECAALTPAIPYGR